MDWIRSSGNFECEVMEGGECGANKKPIPRAAAAEYNRNKGQLKGAFISAIKWPQNLQGSATGVSWQSVCLLH